MAEEAEKMALCTQGFEGVDWREVEKHEDEDENNLIDNEMLDSYVLRQKQSGGPIKDNVTCSEVEMLMEDNIYAAVESIREALSREFWKKQLRTYSTFAMMNRRKR